MSKYLQIIAVAFVINFFIYGVAYALIIPHEYAAAWRVPEMSNAAIIPFLIILIITLFKGLKTGLLTLLFTLIILLTISFTAKSIYFAQGCPVTQQLEQAIGEFYLNGQSYKIADSIINCKPWEDSGRPTFLAHPEGFFGFVGGPAIDSLIIFVAIVYFLLIASALTVVGTIRLVLLKVVKSHNSASKTGV